MKFFYLILTLPFFIFAKIFYKLNLYDLHHDFNECQINLLQVNELFDEEIINILFIAEDHRICKHYGIDHYAMIRALYSTTIRKQFQGASTIAQQYVRVVTKRYERTWIRKFREQLLAVLISSKFSDRQIATAYLKIAFLGSGMNGLNGYLKWKNINHLLSIDEKIAVVSRLKYPEPLKNKERWQSKMIIRTTNISSKLKKSLPTCL